MTLGHSGDSQPQAAVYVESVHQSPVSPTCDVGPWILASIEVVTCVS